MRFLRITGLALFGYLLFLGVRAQDAFHTQYLILSGVTVWAVAAFAILRRELTARHVRQLLLAIVLFGGVARFLWAVYIPTRPVSDFRGYHERAVKIVQGRIPLELSKNPGYPLLGLAFYHFASYQLPSGAISALAVAAVLAVMLPHTILEVQARYHHPLLPFLVLASGVGLYELVSASAGR